jgi:hypothetical protein
LGKNKRQTLWGRLPEFLPEGIRRSALLLGNDHNSILLRPSLNQLYITTISNQLSSAKKGTDRSLVACQNLPKMRAISSFTSGCAHRLVLVLLLEEGQVRQDVHAVDAAVRPEVQHQHAAPKLLRTQQTEQCTVPTNALGEKQLITLTAENIRILLCFNAQMSESITSPIMGGIKVEKGL